MPKKQKTFGRLSFFVSDRISFTMLISDRVFPMREYSVGANIVRQSGFPLRGML